MQKKTGGDAILTYSIQPVDDDCWETMVAFKVAEFTVYSWERFCTLFVRRVARLVVSIQASWTMRNS